MGVKGVPQEHLAMGVAAFRIVTFWLLLPVGWIALAYVQRKSKALRLATLNTRENPEPDTQHSEPTQ
jgi:uncharacterized membrane protein YbhN (UPF0104 family)